MRVFVLCTVMALTTGLFAEDVQAPVKLKDEVALSIRNLQFEAMVLEKQETVKRYLEVRQALDMKLVTALKDSGIDATKYTLNNLSLDVSAIPAKESK